MIVSFHPLFEADTNIICAGREPNAGDLAAVRAAEAVVLPQGCSHALYQLASGNCPHVFPNYAARFNYPKKSGQIRLFRKTHTAHPQTKLFASVADYRHLRGGSAPDGAFQPPCVFKFDWGGEGETVFLINSPKDFKRLLQKAADFEGSGQKGFLLQNYVPTTGKTLRVVIIGRTLISYWRIQENSDAFISSVSRGARIDTAAHPELQKKAEEFVCAFCHKTDINLAGFDVIFTPPGENSRPLMLEINYFFGRRGLGGSDAYYRILTKEIDNWLANTVNKRN